VTEPVRPVVVTGAAGFIGSHLARALIERRHRVVATDLPDALPDRVLAGLDASKVTYVAGDLRDASTLDCLLDAAEGTADVVHVAAILQFAEMAAALGQRAPTPMDAFEVFEVNATATWRLCAQFASSGSLGRFVYVSTRSVFGSAVVDGPTIDEASPPSPVGIYGASKAAAERGVLAFRDVFDLDLAVARVTGVYGPWQGPVSWIGKAVEGVLAGSGYATPAGGDDRYEFTYVKDTVRGLLALVTAPKLRHDIYHVSSGEMHSLSDVAKAFRKAEPQSSVEFGDGSQPGMRTRLPLSGERIDDELGFRSRWELDEAIADYLRVERTGDYGVEASAPLRDVVAGPRP
jgi:nucleoside-diphosphate-sugar epimerase